MVTTKITCIEMQQHTDGIPCIILAKLEMKFKEFIILGLQLPYYIEFAIIHLQLKGEVLLHLALLLTFFYIQLY